jgi:hypothetical protein
MSPFLDTIRYILWLLQLVHIFTPLQRLPMNFWAPLQSVQYWALLCTPTDTSQTFKVRSNKVRAFLVAEFEWEALGQITFNFCHMDAWPLVARDQLHRPCRGCIRGQETGFYITWSSALSSHLTPPKNRKACSLVNIYMSINITNWTVCSKSLFLLPDIRWERVWSQCSIVLSF